MLSMTEPFVTAEINYRRENAQADLAGTAQRRRLRRERRQRHHARWTGHHLPGRAALSR